MILPIYALGQPVLKRVSEPIKPEYPDLQQLIEDMFETMYHAHGIGLAAPQVGLGVRLFVVDTAQTYAKKNTSGGIKKAFINPVIISETGESWSYEEGCLSIPNITGEVERLSRITVSYMDEQFNQHVDEYDGIEARVIQHEYDHIEGILFIERLSALKRRLLKRKLDAIKSGKIESDYKMKFNAKLLM